MRTSRRTDYINDSTTARSNWANLSNLAPYLWEYRGRVLLALLCLVLAKAASVGVPLVLKEIVDHLDVDGGAVATMPLALLLAYGVLKVSTSLLGELRDIVFTRVRFRAMRRLTSRTLELLHSLSLRFHLDRKTGAISSDLQRGSASLSSLLNYMVFNLLPVLVEFVLVAVVLLVEYDLSFTLVIFAAVIVYGAFTFSLTNWRMEHRHTMNRLEAQANNEAVDSLINYETVKYFGAEHREVSRCDETLARWEDAAVLTRTSMGALNIGQALIIALGATGVMVLASSQVIEGAMSLGDLVLVNAFLLQLFMPLGFLGLVYRQIKYAFADMDRLVKLLGEEPEVADADDARGLDVQRGEVLFDAVGFAYSEERPILRDVSFRIRPGQKLAVVGASGAGKSTLGRLLFRFYDVSSGAIRIDGQDIRQVTQESLRRAIGVVPQDTVLFNDTLFYNLAYAAPDASPEQIYDAAKRAHIHEFIESLPEGYQTVVGERGLKLSGGEKQRVAIARIILKNPPILVFDEATSALDSKIEQSILVDLKAASANHTTLVIAHRLSTTLDADEILVMDEGRVIERGSHESLLARDGAYAQLWALQLKEKGEAEQTMLAS